LHRKNLVLHAWSATGVRSGGRDALLRDPGVRVSKRLL
jgi:hypothetical protein